MRITAEEARIKTKEARIKTKEGLEHIKQKRLNKIYEQIIDACELGFSILCIEDSDKIDGYNIKKRRSN